MKANINMKLTYLKPSALTSILAAAMFHILSTPASAQGTVTKTTTTTERATVAQYAPGSERLIVTTRGGPAPMHYSVSKETVFVDETGAPVVVEKITRGIPVTVHFVRDGERMIASRVVVQQPTPVKITKSEAKAMREYYESLARTAKDPREKAEAKAQHAYYDKLEEELKD